jgi:hypothetical protein
MSTVPYDGASLVYSASTGGAVASNRVPVNTKSGNYTLLYSDFVVRFTAAATATLDSTLPVGTAYRIKFKGTSGVLTITPSSGLIEGVASLVVATHSAAVDVVFDGTNWDAF